MKKKRFAGILKFWEKLGKVTRFLVISILCGLIGFGIMARNEDWSRWSVKEENYNTLEKIAYDIIENKNILQSTSESNLREYNVFISNDRINIELYAEDLEWLDLTISKDYEIQSFQRRSLKFGLVMIGIFLFLMIGISISGIIHLIY